jgi:hypothetical protein
VHDLTELECINIHYIHPVHAVFRFAELTHESVSMQRFLDLLDGLEIEDRYAIVNYVASLVGMKQTKEQHELDLQLKRCRQFKEACMLSELEESQAIRAFVDHTFDSLFMNVWKKTVVELSKSNDCRSGETLSCKIEVFEKNNKELWRTYDRDSHFRIECFRRYMLFGEQVAGPLIGYC